MATKRFSARAWIRKVGQDRAVKVVYDYLNNEMTLREFAAMTESASPGHAQYRLTVLIKELYFMDRVLLITDSNKLTNGS